MIELWGLRWDREYSHSGNFITEETRDLYGNEVKGPFVYLHTYMLTKRGL